MSMKYIIYAISTIRDVINYNYFEDITEDVLDRIEKELAFIEDCEDTPYTEEMCKTFHMDLLNLNVHLLPTIDRLKIDSIIDKPPEYVEEFLQSLPESQQLIVRDMWKFFRDGGINPRTG